MSEDRAYALVKMECIKQYKKAYLIYKNATQTLRETFGVTAQELIQIQDVALQEEAKEAETLYALAK